MYADCQRNVNPQAAIERVGYGERGGWPLMLLTKSKP